MDAVVKNLIQEVEKLKWEKKFNEAIKKLEIWLSKYNDYRIYEEIADIYLYQWKHSKALKAVNFALKINKDSATWNYLKWFILLSKNKTKEAIKYLELSNSLMPNNSEVLRNLWWAYSMTWEWNKWIYILKRALNISPNDELIIEDLAMALIWAWKLKEWNNLLEKIWKSKITVK